MQRFGGWSPSQMSCKHSLTGQSRNTGSHLRITDRKLMLLKNNSDLTNSLLKYVLSYFYDAVIIFWCHVVFLVSYLCVVSVSNYHESTLFTHLFYVANNIFIYLCPPEQSLKTCIIAIFYLCSIEPESFKTR